MVSFLWLTNGSILSRQNALSFFGGFTCKDSVNTKCSLERIHLYNNAICTHRMLMIHFGLRTSHRNRVAGKAREGVNLLPGFGDWWFCMDLHAPRTKGGFL